MVDNSYDPLFNYAGQKYNVDPALLRTVFRNESSENANTRPSSAGALGGMQMLPDTARAYGAPDPTDMRMAIPAAAIYLRKGLDAYGSPEGALAAYHGGFDTSQWGPRTMAYVQKGITNYPQVKQDMANAAAASTPLSAPMPSDQSAPSDPDVEAGAKILSGGATAATPNQAPPSDPDVEAGKQILAAPPPPVATTTPEAVSPSTTTTTGDVVPTTFGDLGNAASGIGSAIGSAGHAIAHPLQTINDALNAPVSPDTQAWLNQPATPGFTRSSVLPIAVNPDIHNLGGIQMDWHGPVGSALGMFQRNTPDVVAARGNITPDMALTLMRPGMAGAANPLLRDSVASRIAQVSDRARAQTAAPLTDAEIAPLGSFADKPVTANPEGAWVAPGATMPVPETQAASGVATGANAAPSNAGAAATPASLIPALTPAEAATAEGRQFQQTAIDRQQSGEDSEIYVPNSVPTAGQKNPALSPEENSFRNAYPSQAKAADDLNNSARVEYFDSHTSDPIAMEQLTQAREAQAQQDLTNAFGNKQDVDAQPLVDSIDQTLASGGNKRSVVKNTLNNVRQSLFDPATGELETDPEILYSARQNITDMMAKGKSDPSSDEALAMANLNQLKGQLDGIIEQGAPGYKDYLSNYQTNSMPIDQAQVLNNMRTKIVNAQGNMLLNPLNQQLGNIVKARAAPGINPAKSLTPDTMDMLFNLRNDLQRKAYADSVNQGVGSNTVRNAIQAAKSGTLNPLVAEAVHGAILGGATSLLGPAGVVVNPLLRMSAAKLSERRIAKASAENDERMQQLFSGTAQAQ